jgi:hypothetical protein
MSLEDLIVAMTLLLNELLENLPPVFGFIDPFFLNVVELTFGFLHISVGEPR